MTFGEEDKAVVFKITLEREINGELLCLCSAVVLGAAVGVLEHKDQGAAPSSSQPHACVQLAWQGKLCPRKPALLIKRAIQSAARRSAHISVLSGGRSRGPAGRCSIQEEEHSPQPTGTATLHEAASRSAIRAGLGARVNQNLAVIIAEPV